MHYHGTTGNDDIDGTNNADQFNLKQGGEDIANGGGNDDYFTMGGAFDAGDTIDGGDGTDIINLNGNYFGARALQFAAHTMNNIEHMVLGAGHDYDLKFVGANIDGEFLIHAEGLGASDRLILRTAGNQVFGVLAGAGNDVLTKGSTGLDVFDLSAGGNDTVHSDGNLCTVIMGATLNAGDTIEDVSEIDLDGDYTGANRLVMGTHVANASTVTYHFAGGHDYDVVMNDANLITTNGFINSASVGASNSFRFDGSAEDDATFEFEMGGANDRLTGGGRGDIFHMLFGGNDTIFGGGGNDVIQGVINVDAGDRIDGGAGNDTLSLAGTDYDFTLTNRFLSIETLKLQGAFTFVIRTVDANVAAGETMIVDATGMTTGGRVEFYGGSERDGDFIFRGGAVTTDFRGGRGDDIVRGGAGAYSIDLTLGGDDTVFGKGMEFPEVFMAGALTAADSIRNVYLIQLNGNYSGARKLVLGPNTIVDAGTVVLAGGHNYDITANEGTIVHGPYLTIDANTLDSAHRLIFDGSAETTGAFSFLGGAGNDTLTGGAKDDAFSIGGGHDTVHGGPGDDYIVASDNYGNTDHIDGGTGLDTLVLGDADYTVLPMKDNLTSIERIKFGPFQTYILEMVDGNVGAGKTMEIDGFLLSGTAHLHVDASRETDGKYVFLGGSGNDIIVGSHGDDLLLGSLGHDVFQGGPGADTLEYHTPDESSSTSYDTVLGFAGSVDRFDLDVAVTGINMRFNGGAVSSASFDSDMQSIINSGHLGKHHAVLCDLSGGDYDGYTFLAIDANGVKGYQAGGDFLISVTDFGSLSVNIFI